MRFDSIRVERFGSLRDFTTDTGPGQESSLPSIVVVLGPNESGKSTFFSFLTTLLYGFRPTTRDKHPYAPWNGGNPEGSAKLTMDDGTVMEVHRRLLTTPKGTLISDDQRVAIANRPLDGVAHVSRAIFGQVYAVSLAELTEFKDASRRLLEDQLGALGARNLVSPRAVVADLDAKSREYWKNDRRGKLSRVQELQAKQQKLNDELREAVDLDRSLRDKTKKQEQARARLRTLQTEIDDVRNRRNVLSRIKELRAGAEAQHEGVQEEDQAVRRAKQRCIEHADETFDIDFSDVPEDVMEFLLTEEFHRDLDKYKNLCHEHRKAEATPGNQSSSWTARLSGPKVGVAGVIVALAALAMTALELGPVLVLAGAVVLLMGVMFWPRSRHTKTATHKTEQNTTTSLEAARTKIVRSLSGFPAEESLLKVHGVELVVALKRLAELVDDLLSRSRMRDKRRQKLDNIHRDITRLTADIAIGLTDRNSPENEMEKERRHEEQLTEEAKRVERVIGELGSDIRRLASSESVDQVEGRREVLRADVREAREAHDRAFVLARIVETADHDFRDQNQPKLLRLAGIHLRHMTGGRYDRIVVGDVGTDALCLNGPSIPKPGSLKGPLSQGTKEQAYLSLRLAILDHLDEGNERLPLILDEALVNWDGQRRAWAFKLLERVSKTRQVIFFTVHEMMATQLQDLGARVITLESDSD